MLRHAATVITASRGLAGLVIPALLLVFDRPWLAFWVFVFAMLTDLIDGWVARATGGDPALGAFLDPLADKLIIGGCWIGLLLRGWAPWWLGGPLLARDLIVATLWRRDRSSGVTRLPSKLGQVATSYEGTAIGILLFHGPWRGVHWPTVGVGVGLAALLLSLLSAILYGARGPLQPRH